MNAKIKITRLDKPQLRAANVKLECGLYSIYFSEDRTTGFVINPLRARYGEEVEITEGPTEVIGTGIVIDVSH